MDDVMMENVEGADKRPTQTERLEEMADFVNTRVFEILTNKMKDRAMVKTNLVSAEEMELFVEANTRNLDGSELSAGLRIPIISNYHVKTKIALSVAEEATADATNKYGVPAPSAPVLSPDEFKRLEVAFTQTEYVGNASSRFKEYLTRCWKLYCEKKSSFKAPYVAVVQSSGFGKSRMLFELARLASEPSSNMKVLYVCARTQESTGYPKATKKLREWLFPDKETYENIVSGLQAIHQHAMNNWETVQDEWLQLFTSTAADIVVETKLKEMKASLKKKLSHSSSEKVVIVVIDEARSLLAERPNCLNHFRLLRHALHHVKDIFGVLVDTNSKISDLAPPASSDPSSRIVRGKNLVSFPPFVLTHTMDLFWHQYCGEQAVRNVKMRDEAVKPADKMTDDQVSDSEETKRGDVADSESKACDVKEEISGAKSAYKDAVISSEQDGWNALVRMGRPMWYSSSKEMEKNDVIEFAATKLLLGHPVQARSYMEDNMFGIASLLCRVGLRPYSTASFAPRAVADLMAILAYVNYEKEAYVSSYASDPMLTLGAIKVWHMVGSALATKILPQLKSLIINEALDTGGIGEVVARIVLLLAMDKCVVGYENYAGQFIAVHAFLEAFGVEEMPVFMSRMRAASGDTKGAFHTWLSKWDGWRMGFTHFVQLKVEPTEETLWYLLGRRAAGIFPRNQKGADLLIPIFWTKTDGEAAFESEMKAQDAVDAKVSLILIQVKNRSPHDSEFPKSATTKLCPSFVFGEMSKKPKTSANILPIGIPAKDANEEFGEGPPTEDVEGLSIEESVEGSPMEDVEGSSINKAAEDPPIEKLGEIPLSKKSVRDVICIYMNVQEDSQHHRFVYAKEFEDGNKSKDGSEAKLADTSGKTKRSNSMKGASSSTSGKSRTRAVVGESKKTHGSKFKAGDSKTESVTTDSKTKAASELMFTLCFRSVRCDTYKFLDAEVAGRLASLVGSLWDPLVLVDGDLKHRQEVEKFLSEDEPQPLLSQVMGDEELRTIARQGLADPPGRHNPVEPAGVKGQDDKIFKQQASGQKRGKGDQGGDSRKHQRYS